jgi:hypothetical protein
MTRRSAFAGLALLLSAAGPSLAAPNLLVNPGFETGDLTGWTETCVDALCGVGTIHHSGNFGFGTASSATLSQTVTDTAGETLEAGAWFQDGATPQFPGTLDIKVDGKSIGSFIENGGWTFFSATFLATGSDTVEFDLGSGSGAAFFDDAVVTAPDITALPEPSGLAAIVVGLVGLGGMKIRSAQTGGRLREAGAA